jgi:biopolymer transport protein ExbD
MRRYRRTVTQPSDIAFLLILFFLILSGAVVDRALEVSASEPAASPQQERTVTITVDTAGVVRLGKGILTPSASSQIQGADVVVHVVGDTRWEFVVAALSTVTQYGATSVSLTSGEIP